MNSLADEGPPPNQPGGDPSKHGNVELPSSVTELERPGEAPGDRGTTLALCALFVLCWLLQGFAWWRLDGYQLADSIEYLERARMLVRGESIEGAANVRSFAFSLVFVPLFLVERAFDIESPGGLFVFARLLQIAFATCLVRVTWRIGSRLAGARAGWLGALFLISNPYFIRFSISPVADIAAALCLALGAERLLWRSGARTAFKAGVWLGLGVLCAYKSVLFAGLLLACIGLRDRWRFRGTWMSACAGLALLLVIQVAIDRVTYGVWGSSLRSYLYHNGLSRITHIGWYVHQHSQGWISEQARKFAVWLYNEQYQLLGEDFKSEGFASRMRLAPTWYLSNLPTMLVAPALALAVFGLARFLAQPTWPSSIILLMVSGFAYVTATKGDKSFRLWLPIAPFLALMAGVGWSVLTTAITRPWVKGLLSVSAAVSALLLCLRAVDGGELNRHGAYWQAMEFVNRSAASKEPVGAAYEWAVFLRSRRGLDMVKSPYPVDTYPKPEEIERDELAARRAQAVRDWAGGLDWLIGHSEALIQAPEFLRFLSERFEVAAIFYEAEERSGLGPVLCLRRVGKQGSPRRSLLRVRRGAEAETLRRELDGGKLHVFERERADGTREQLELVGWELEPIPGSSEVWWLTYHWCTDTGLEHDYQLIDRFTSPEGKWSYQNNHWPAHGAYRTQDWLPGEIISESHIFLPAADPFQVDLDYRPLGGPYRRGDLIPVSLWLQVIEQDYRGGIQAAMQGQYPLPQRLEPPLDNAIPALLSLVEHGRTFEAALAEVDARFDLTDAELAEIQRRRVVARESWVRDGQLVTKDGLIEIERFFLDVGPLARLADDGRPVPGSFE